MSRLISKVRLNSHGSYTLGGVISSGGMGVYAGIPAKLKVSYH